MIDEMDLDRLAHEAVQTMVVRGACEADRDDMVQEARIRIWQAQGRVDTNRSTSDARGYLFVAGRSAAIEFLRWRQRNVLREDSIDEAALPQQEAAPAPDVEADEKLITIVFLAGLTPVETEIVFDRLGLEKMSDATRSRPGGWRFDRVRSARGKLRRVLEALRPEKKR
jgi:DNA-directed RNA polymerase specialized sigma24 family protein